MEPVTPVGEIAAGAHGYLWFGTFGAIGRLTPSSGKVTLFQGRDGAERLAASPDGSIWFSENYNKIGRITPDGHFSTINLPRRVEPVTSLAAGADGSVWYTAKPRTRSGVVGRITFDG